MNKLFFVLLCSTFTFQSFSQELQFESGREKHDKKPQLFHALANKSGISSSFIDEVLNYQVHEQVEVAITNGFRFKGKINAINNEVPGLTTISIQSSEVEGLVLSVSKITLSDLSIAYRGILISKNHADALILEKDPVTGNYNWNKKMFSQMIAD